MRWKFKWIFLSIILIFVGLFFLDSALNTDKRLLRGMLNISEIPAFKILECDHHGNFMDTDNVCYLVLENSDRFGLLLTGREFISRSAD